MKKKLKLKKTIHIKILISITFSVSVMIIILSLLLYIYFEKELIGRIYESESNNLFQAGVSTKLMRELSGSIAIQMYNDLSLSGLFFVPGKDPVDTYNTLTSFKKYRDLIPYIHSIYIYNPENNTFYINSPAKSDMIQAPETFFDKEIISLLKNNKNINSRIPLPRIIKEPGILKEHIEEYGVYSFIYNLSGVNSSEYPGIIVINISENWVRNIIDSLDKNPGIKALIINNEDKLLISDTGRKLLSTAGIRSHLGDSLAGNKKSGYIVINTGGEKKFLVFSLIDSFGWIFIKSIPYNNVMSGIYEIRKNLIIIAISILITGSLLSFILAGKLYKPIDTLFKQLSLLEGKRKGNIPVLKQYNLKRILTQSKILSRYELDKFLNELNIEWEENNSLNLTLLEIDGYKKFCRDYSPGEQNLLRLGILDTALKTVRTAYAAEGIELGDNRLLIIVNLKNEKEDIFNNRIKTLVVQILESITNSFKLSVSAVISRIENREEEVSELFDGILNISHYKYIIGSGAVIREAEIPSLHKKGFVYSYKKEEVFTDALNLGNKEKALAVYDEIMEYAPAYGYNAVITTRTGLANALNKTIDKLKGYGFLNFSYNFYDFFRELNDTETMAEANRIFYELINNLLVAARKRNGQANYYLISRVIGLIDAEYMDINLGISTLADKFKLSAAYLGRLFFKFTGKSMTDYINEVRITRANGFLENTRQPVLEIMKMTGFTNKTHFYNMFKKYNGTTPKFYRQKSVENNLKLYK